MKALWIFLLCSVAAIAGFNSFPYQHLPMSTSGWTFVNQSGATVDTTSGTFNISVSSPGDSQNNLVFLGKPITNLGGTWSVDTSFGFLTPSHDPTAFPWKWEGFMGPAFYDSSSGHFTTCQWNNDGDGWFIAATRWSDYKTTVTDVVLDYYEPTFQNPTYARIRAGEDGGFRYCDVSMDAGRHWVQFYKEGRMTYMTADYIGIGMNTQQGSHVGLYKYILSSWLEIGF